MDSLVSIRKKKGVTQKKLGLCVGLRASAISRIERGLEAPSPGVRVAIPFFLKVKSSQIRWPKVNNYKGGMTK